MNSSINCVQARSIYKIPLIIQRSLQPHKKRWKETDKIGLKINEHKSANNIGDDSAFGDIFSRIYSQPTNFHSLYKQTMRT